MSRRQAGSARALVRGFVLLFGGLLVLVGVGCGRENFDLLPAAGTGGAASGMAGGGAGGVATGVAGSGGNRSGAGGTGDANGGRTGLGGFGHGGGPIRSSGGGGNTTSGFGGSSFGGGDNICLPGEACVDGGARCPPDTTGACHRCTGDDDCTHDAPYCDPIDGRCVECFPGKDQCPDGETCDTAVLRCAKTCASSMDCTRYCSRNHICVECQQNADCRGGPGQEKYSCFLGYCVECQVDGDCTDVNRPHCEALQCVPRP